MKDLMRAWSNSPMFWAFITGLNAGSVINSLRDGAPWWWLLFNIVALCWSTDLAIKARRKEVRP